MTYSAEEIDKTLLDNAEYQAAMALVTGHNEFTESLKQLFEGDTIESHISTKLKSTG